VGWANSLQGVEVHSSTQYLNQVQDLEDHNYKMIKKVENEMKRQHLDQAKQEA
jgi:hypothetical protein